VTVRTYISFLLFLLHAETCVTSCKKLHCYGELCSLLLNPQVGGSRLVGCPRLFLQQFATPIPGGFPWGRAMPWGQGTQDPFSYKILYLYVNRDAAAATVKHCPPHTNIYPSLIHPFSDFPTHSFAPHHLEHFPTSAANIKWYKLLPNSQIRTSSVFMQFMTGRTNVLIGQWPLN
jgi:hypothetical protein